MHSYIQVFNHVLYNFKTIIVLFAFSVLLFNSANTIIAAESQSAQEQVKVEQKAVKNSLEEQWGIEITALRLTAAGHMIDFRYRVLDAEKAGPLFVRQIKPYLVHHASGKTLAVPNTAKIGTLRNSNTPKENRIYWMFFGNKGLVKKGDKVSIVIGDFKAESLEVL